MTHTLLYIAVGDFSTENFVELYNNGKAAIAFRTRVSAQNMFVVKHGDGVLEAGDSCRIHISSKPTTAYDLTDEIPAVKFAIDLLEVDNRFHELGAKTFWQRYSPEGVRHSIVANCSFSSLKPVATRRFGSPSRVSWADESADESDKVVRSVVSPNPEKHRRHIAEMESILSDLKGQLSSDSVRTEGVEDTPEVNIEAILQIGKALLKESVDLTKEESSVSTERHRDALRFQSQPEVDTIEQPSVQPAISVASPRPLSKPRGRLFELMIKNVSRDQLLTSEEAEVPIQCTSIKHTVIYSAACHRS